MRFFQGSAVPRTMSLIDCLILLIPMVIYTIEIQAAPTTTESPWDTRVPYDEVVHARTPCPKDKFDEWCNVTEGTAVCSHLPEEPVKCKSLYSSPTALVITNTSVSFESLSPMAAMTSLKRVTLNELHSEIQLTELLTLFPYVKTFDLGYSEVLTNVSLHDVWSYTNIQVQQIFNFHLNHRGLPLQRLGLDYIQSFHVKLTNGPYPLFFLGASIGNLFYDDPQSTHLNWAHLPVGYANLNVLNITMTRCETMVYGIPYVQLRRLYIHVHNVSLERAHFWPEKPYQAAPDFALLVLKSFKINNEVIIPEGARLHELQLIDCEGDFHNIKQFPVRLHKLRIQNMNVKFITAESFQGAYDLAELHLVNVGLQAISSEAFQNVLLHTLDLSNNQLTQFNPHHEHLEDMQEVNLASNKLTIVPESIVRNKIQRINLSNNLISSLTVKDSDVNYWTSKAFDKFDLTRNPIICNCDFYVFQAVMPFDLKVNATCNDTIIFGEADPDWCPPYEVLRTPRSVDHIASAHDKARRIIKLKQDQAAQRALDALKRLRQPKRDSNFTKSKLYPEFGVGFRRVGKEFYPSCEEFYFNLHISWPDLALPETETSTDVFMQLCNSSDTLIQEICSDFLPLIQFVTSQSSLFVSSAREKMSSLHTLLHNDIFSSDQFSEFSDSQSKDDHRNQRHRRKRRSPQSEQQVSTTAPPNVTVVDFDQWRKVSHGLSAAYIFHPMAAGAMHAQLSLRRFEIMGKALSILAQRQSLIKNNLIDIRGDMALAMDIVADQFEEVNVNILTLHDLMIQSNKEITQICQKLNKAVNILTQRTQAVRVLSAFTSKYLHLYDKRLVSMKSYAIN